MSDKLCWQYDRGKTYDKRTLGLQNYWRMANTEDDIVPRFFTFAEIRLNTLLGIRRGWHYNRGQYSGGALYLSFR